MNDYGELLKLPYSENDILEPLKKLIKYDKIKPFSLEKTEANDNIFHLVGRKFLVKAKVSIQVKELEKGLTKVEVISKSRVCLISVNKKIVKEIVNLILKELENCDKTSDNFEVEILNIKNTSKKVRGIIALLVLFYFIYSILFSFSEDYKINVAIDAGFYLRLQLLFSVITTFVFLFISKFKSKSYIRKRSAKIKSTLYNLLEKKVSKTKKTTVSETKSTNPTTKLLEQAKPNINKGLSFIKKIKTEKPKLFWLVTISFGALLTYLIISSMFGVKSLDGEFVQQMGSLSSEYKGWETVIKFKNGKFYPDGSTVGYSYKIKGNKIYVTMNGKEAESDFKVKNANTLIVGDGVIDEVCYGALCGPNTDGIYIKK